MNSSRIPTNEVLPACAERRRLIASGLALFATEPRGWAQPGRKTWRIGVLAHTYEGHSMVAGALGLLGYREGIDLRFDAMTALDKADLLPKLAARLVASKPDLLLGTLNPEIMALKQATSKIPIVMLYATAPVEAGLVASLARPGGNITGTTTNTPELNSKLAEIVRDAVPRLSRVAWLHDPDYPGMSLYSESFTQAATALGLLVTPIAVRTVSDLTLESLARDRPDAMVVAMTGVLLERNVKVIEFAARYRIPALYSIRRPVLSGGLMSYSADFGAMANRTAWIIDKILKGAKPSDIPVEEPAQFMLTINLRTAKAVGLAIPKSLLLRADELIE